MRLPGRWIRTVAARLCTKRTMDRVIDPVISDVQLEYEEAMRAQGWVRAAGICIRGYSAFWKAVGLYTAQSGLRTFGAYLAAEKLALGRTVACTLITFISLTLALSALPMLEFYSRLQNLEPTLLLLPQAIPPSIPTALAVGIAYGTSGSRMTGRGIRGVLAMAIAGTLLAFAAMLIIPDANQAFRVAVAQELDSPRITSYSMPRGANELSLSELSRRGQEYDETGLVTRAREFRRAYHIRFALPVASFVLSLFALAVGALLKRGVERVAVIVISLGLYWAILIATGRNTNLPPAFCVWLPNLVFTTLALGLLRLRPERQTGATD